MKVLESFSRAPSSSLKLNFVNPGSLLFPVQELRVKEPVFWLLGHSMSLDLSFLFCNGIEVN